MKKNKDEFKDDGRTIANMDIDGMPHRLNSQEKNRKKVYDISKEEKKQLIIAGYKAALPVLIVGLLGMFLAMLLIKWWLS